LGGAALLARAVVAFDAEVADLAGTARRRMLADPSTTTVTPASDSARSTRLACAAVAVAASTARATSADASRSPAPRACEINEFVSERTSAPVCWALDTDDLPGGD
jgi:hypothetical protein